MYGRQVGENILNKAEEQLHEYKWEFGTIEHDKLNIFIFEESSVVFGIG